MNTELLDSLAHWLLRTSFEASILILAVFALRGALGKRLSPAWRIGLWMVVGLKLLLPAFIPAGFGLGEWGAVAQAAEPAVMETAAAPVTVAVAVASQESTPAAAPVQIDWSLVLLGVWFAGAAVMLILALARQWRFERELMRRPVASDARLLKVVALLVRLAGLRQPVRVIMMPAGTTPAVVGFRRARLLLPEDWDSRFDAAGLRHVLLHELLHIRQNDLLWNWAALAVQALHWFNPLVWLVVSRFQSDRELRCDARALELLAPGERLAYGQTLLRVQESFFAPPAIAGLAPCVRNHPTLRQRILMIAQPTSRQPLVQTLLVLTLSVLVSYSFTTARAAEKEVPAKNREGATTRPAESEKPGKGEREDGKPMREGERDGVKKTGDRDGEGGKKTGDRDGEGTKKPGTRDGDKPRTGARDGEGEKKPGARDGDKPRTGARDGEGEKKPGARDGDKPRTGARDGEGEKKPGARDGDKPRTGARDGEGAVKTRKGEGDTASKSGEVITLHVTAGGDTVLINGEKVPMSGLRGHLSAFLPKHPSAKVIVSGDADVPLGSLNNTVDAVRDNGNKNVGIKSE